MNMSQYRTGFRLRAEFHRHETPDGVLTWLVTIDSSNGEPRSGRPRNFELDGKPLSGRQGRALRLRHQLID